MSPVWFITAASSGFGHEIALLALSRGHTVIATARDAARIQDLADAGANTLSFDVTAPLESIEAVAKDIFAEHGRVDYLVNTAGYILDGAVEEITPKEAYDCFNTNVFGVLSTLKAFLPHLRAQPLGEDGNRATVVTFGSLGSWSGGAGFSIYSMTKWCASALAESLDLELAPFAIRATVVEPGYFRTSFLSSGARVTAKQSLSAYADENTPTGKTKAALSAVAGKQPGDVKKGCAVIVDMLTGSGVAKGRALPVRIVLGSDCEAKIRDKCAKSLSLLDEWAEVVRSTDYPKE